MDIEARDDRIPVAASLRVPVVLIGVPDDPAGCTASTSTSRRRRGWPSTSSPTTGHDRIALIGHPADDVERDLNYVRPLLRRGARGGRAARPSV